jgi:hypothetical protein
MGVLWVPQVKYEWNAGIQQFVTGDLFLSS